MSAPTTPPASPVNRIGLTRADYDGVLLQAQDAFGEAPARARATTCADAAPARKDAQ